MEQAKQEAESQADRNELLLWAAARGLLADAVELMAQGAEGNVKDKHGRSPAHYAASKGHLDVLQFFSSKGVDLEAEDPKGRTPLHYAALGDHPETLKYLVSRSSWLEGQDYRDDTPLHLAARRGWFAGVELLLTAGAKPGVVNKRGLTALAEALVADHVDVAELLLKFGADPLATAGSFSLLHVVCGLGYVGGVKLLLGQKGADVNSTSNVDGASPLHAAAMSGSLPLVELLLKHGADAAATSNDTLLPWEVVAADSGAVADQLRKRLKDAAGKAGAKAKPPQSRPPAAAAAGGGGDGTKRGFRGGAHVQSEQPSAAAAGAAVGQGKGMQKGASVKVGEEVSAAGSYAQQFKVLGAEEQQRRLDAFARMSLAELEHLEVLSNEAKEAVFQVSRARQLLGAYQAVAALRADATFQEDAAEPRVQQALEHIRDTNSVEEYKDDRAVMSVMMKLKKFQAVLMENGAMRVGLKELLLKPGQTLEEVAAQDKAQKAKLEKALEAARQAAVRTILGEGPPAPATPSAPSATPAAAIAAVPPSPSAAATEMAAAGAAATTLAAAGTAGRAEGGGAAAGGLRQRRGKEAVCEIEELDDPIPQRSTGRQQHQKEGQTELDALLAEEQAAGGEGRSWKQQLWHGFVDSSKQAVRALFMVALMYLLMWYLNLLPTQSEEFLAGRGPAVGNPAAAGNVAAE